MDEMKDMIEKRRIVNTTLRKEYKPDQEHLKILKQGVEVWNQWRKEHPDERPKLSEVDLSGVNLCGINLRETYLCEANLCFADLREANLHTASLNDAKLSCANLSKADLRSSNLTSANLRQAICNKANFCGARLCGAFLTKAKLREAKFYKADLSHACLSSADLRKADFSRADLGYTHLNGAIITGSVLYRTARTNWIIDDVVCEYVFLDEMGTERIPEDRDFRPGEFKERYKSLPTFEYYFEHGFTPIDAMVMDQVVQTINQQNPEYEVKLTTLDSRGQPHAVFTVIRKEYAAPAQQQITTDYERRIAALEGKQEQLMQIVATLVNQPQYIGELIMGDKRMIQTGRDYLEHIAGDAATGASSHDDQKEGETGGSEPPRSEGQSTQ